MQRVDRRHASCFLSGLTVVIASTTAWAEPVSLHVVADSSRVRYHITHTIADVTDLAGQPAGEARVEGDASALHLEGRVTVDLRTLQTGITQRDHHIKSAEYLDVERFPEAEFLLAAVEPDSGGTAAKEGSKPPDWQGRARGKMRLHGVEREMQVPLRLWWMSAPGQGPLRVQSDFVLQLADFGIKRPKKLVFKAGKSVDVHLDLLFAP